MSAGMPSLGHDENMQPSPTMQIASWLSDSNGCIDDFAMEWSRHCFLDWLAVTIAGAREPMIDKLVSLALADGPGAMPLIGRTERVTPSWAVLINGTSGHALDYDDVNITMRGHPTVPVMPAVFATALQSHASGHDVLEAFAMGYEVEAAVGDMAGADHYADGYHPTGTLGALGAAAAVARLKRIETIPTAHALGIAAAQASGLKSSFGTMTKPFQAGRAAQTGYLSALMAMLGYTGAKDTLENPQGFLGVLAPKGQVALFATPRETLEVTQTCFKYHAACFLTHSSIESCRQLREFHGFSPGEVETVTLHVHPGHRAICAISAPSTGLESKFSLVQTAAMALLGYDTAALESYSDDMAARSDLVSMRQRVNVVATEAASLSCTEVSITLSDGRVFSRSCDVAVPSDDLEQQWTLLSRKARSLIVPVLGAEKATRILAMMAEIEAEKTLDALMEACR